MDIKSLRHEYASLRKASTQSATRLQKAGFMAPSFPKSRQLKTQAELRGAIQQAKRFMHSPGHTVPGARMEHDVYGIENRDTEAELKRERQIFKYSTRKAEQWGLSRFEQNVLRAVRRQGVSGREIGKRNIKQFTEYVQFRKSVSNEKTPYSIQEYTEQYREMKKKGMSVQDMKYDFWLYRQANTEELQKSAIAGQKYSMNVVSSLWSKYEQERGY